MIELDIKYKMFIRIFVSFNFDFRTITTTIIDLKITETSLVNGLAIDNIPRINSKNYNFKHFSLYLY